MPTGHNMGDGARRRCTARHGTSSGSLICEIIPFWLIIPLLHRRWLKTTALHRPMAGFSGFAPSLYAKPHFSTTLKSLGPSTATKPWKAHLARRRQYPLATTEAADSLAVFRKKAPNDVGGLAAEHRRCRTSAPGPRTAVSHASGCGSPAARHSLRPRCSERRLCAISCTERRLWQASPTPM